MRQPPNKILLFSFFVALFALCVPLQSFASIIHQDTFEYSDSPRNHGWDQIGSNVSVGAWGKDGTGGIKVNYAGQNTAPYIIQKNLFSYSLQEVYVEFDFKVGPNATGGSKFLKFFGKANSPSGYANTTFIMDYNSPVLFQIGYGAGALENDSQNTIRYNGERPEWLNGIDPQVNQLVGRGTINVNDGRWHHYKVFIRYNSNGMRDGEYKVWYDGGLWVHAVSVVNRNNQNSLFFDFVRLGDYTSARNTTNWNLYYDNVVISTAGGIPSTPVNGACGLANNKSFTSLTSMSPELCSTGSVTSFASNSSSSSWECTGYNGGTTASCAATITPAADRTPAAPTGLRVP